MKSCFLCILILAACFVGGCSVNDNNSEQYYSKPSADPLTVALTQDSTLRLPLPEYTQKRTVRQLLTARYADRELDPILVVLELKPASLALVGFTPLGVKIFSCEYNGTELKSNTLLADKVPPLAQIVWDIMLSFYPVSYLKTALPEGFILEDDGHTRVVRQGDRQIYAIHYLDHNTAKDPLSIEHKSFNYKIKLDYLVH